MITEFAKAVGVPQEKILGRSRKVPLPDLRHIYWKLLKDNGDYTWGAIGELNDRTHASIIHGVNKVNIALKMGDRKITRIWEKVKELTVDGE